MTADSTKQRPCPVCGGVQVEFLHAQQLMYPDELNVPLSADIVSCLKCGVAFSKTYAVQADLDHQYEAHSKYTANLYDKAIPEIQKAASPDAAHDLARFRDAATYLTRHVPGHATRILDVGCATGGFLRALVAVGYHSVVGLDPSPSAAAVARASGIEAYAGSLFHYPSHIGTFDVVLLSHVLEHLVDARAAIDALAALTKTGGLAYVEVPDASHYAEFLVAPFQDFNNEHITHFSPAVLRGLMESAGFTRLDSGTKTILSSPTAKYPAAYGLWRKRGGTPREYAWRRDTELSSALADYVCKSSALLGRIDRALEAELSDDNEIVVWGVGSLTAKLVQTAAIAKRRIAFFVDSAPQRQGMHLLGKHILPPEALKGRPELPIVVASILHEQSILGAIRADLTLENRVITVSVP